MKSTNSFFMNLSLVLLLCNLMIFEACKEPNKNQIIKPVIKKQRLGDMLIYSDSIGTYPEAHSRMEQKIDSLYDLIFKYIKKQETSEFKALRETPEDIEYLRKTILGCKTKYKELFDENAVIYRQVYGKGTGGASGGDLYYYYYLCRYYQDIKLLQLELKDYYDDINRSE